MSKQAVVIMSAIAVAVLTVVILLFVFAPERPSPVALPQAFDGSKPETAVRDVEKTTGKAILEETTGVPPEAKEGENAVKIEIFGTAVYLPRFAAEVLKPVSSFVSVIDISKKEPQEKEAAGQLSLFSPPVATSSSGRIPTEEEIFEIIWPKYYRGYLFKVRDLMVNDGFISSADHKTFNSDKEIYTFVKAMDAYAFSKGWITGEDYNNFVRGIDDVLTGLIDQEKNNLRSGKTQSRLLPGMQRFVRVSKPAILRDLLDGLIYVLLQAKPAYAVWVTKGDCYKDDNPLSKEKGENLATICCNCGFFCVKVCVFRDDCGTGGAACNVQLGCLNAVCQNQPNAIWDQQTGICGCG